MLRWERAYGCGRAKVRRRGGGGAKMCGGSCAGVGALVWRCVEEGALFGVRWCEDVWRKVRWCGGAGVVRGRLRYAAGAACVWVWVCGSPYKRLRIFVYIGTQERGSRCVTISSQLCNSRVIAIG